MSKRKTRAERQAERFHSYEPNPWTMREWLVGERISHILRGARRCRDGWRASRAEVARLRAALAERDARRCGTCEHLGGVLCPLNWMRLGTRVTPSYSWHCADWKEGSDEFQK
jgi:hypothetical protein